MGLSPNIKQLLESATPLQPHQEIFIRMQGTPTGSTVFGVAEADTDEDVILTLKQFRSMKLSTDDCLRYEGGAYAFDEFTSWYVKCASGKVINLLVMYTEEVKSQFVYATQKMVGKVTSEPSYKESIRDKKFRCEEFEKFKGEQVNERDT